MFSDFPLFPEAASSIAQSVDNLYFFLIAVCGFMAFLVCAAVLYFMIKYRRHPGNEIPEEYDAPEWLELGLITSWFIIFMVMFVWGSKLYFENSRPPDDAIEIYATGKQWMWKFQHLNGQREINELHVPVNQPVKLIMGSEDVIHSFYVPYFRVKRDVIPERYTIAWFKATKTGRFHLFCAEYCGTEHSGMVGWVTVMDPSDYQTWEAGGSAERSPAAEGKKLFESYACISCHSETAGARGPNLTGLFGKPVQLRGGQQVMADENYIRQSISDPQSQVVEGFEPIMPTFKGQISEAQMLQLTAYIKTLGASAMKNDTSGVNAAPTPARGAAPSATGSKTNPVPMNTTTSRTN